MADEVQTTQTTQGRGARRNFAPWADPAARPLVRFDTVTKRFGETVAVDALTLDIFPGEFFALLGPPGCGKSTLLRLLAGFETPSEGRVLLDGAVVDAIPPHRRPVNMMFQNYALFPHLTVEGNIAFGLKQERRPRAEIAARAPGSPPAAPKSPRWSGSRHSRGASRINSPAGSASASRSPVRW